MLKPNQIRHHANDWKLRRTKLFDNMANMGFLFLCILVGAVPFSRGQVNHLNLQAEPQLIVPGLTQTLTVTCGPGHLATQYRQIFLLQILTNQNERPLATLQPGQAPTIPGTSDPRVTATGQLDTLSPDTAILKVSVDRPTALDAGRMQCVVVGLGSTGKEVVNTEALVITVHRQAGQVDAMLKEMVADLKREADSLLVQTQTLKQENQRLAQLASAKQAALGQRKAGLQQLRSQMQTLQQTVNARELTLNQTAENLLVEIANVSADAPAMRVAFNALEKTERVYASGVQVQLETVVMNDGNGYNSTTSVFHPPVAGVYCFTTAQLAHDMASAAYRVYSIHKNGTIVSSAYNGDDHQSSTFKQSSTSTIVSLTPFDLVTVYQQYSSSGNSALTPYSNTRDGKSTNFAGYLMY